MPEVIERSTLTPTKAITEEVVFTGYAKAAAMFFPVVVAAYQTVTLFREILAITSLG
jgi:hypothetical protein